MPESRHKASGRAPEQERPADGSARGPLPDIEQLRAERQRADEVREELAREYQLATGRRDVTAIEHLKARLQDVNARRKDLGRQLHELEQAEHQQMLRAIQEAQAAHAMEREIQEDLARQQREMQRPLVEQIEELRDLLRTARAAYKRTTAELRQRVRRVEAELEAMRQRGAEVAGAQEGNNDE